MKDSPAVWCGTYAHYNNGSLKGRWFELEDYPDKESLYEAFQEFHGPGEHEFMLADYQCFPRRYYSECSIPDELFDWLELDEDDRELLEVYLDDVNQDGTIGEARERFQGKYGSPRDWAEEFLEEMGYLGQVPGELRYHIDFESYARDQGIDNVVFVEHEGYTWVFRRD